MPVPPSAFDAPFEGVLLDLDGTLVDSIAAVERSWIQWCGEFGVDPMLLVGMHGVTAANVIEGLLPPEVREEAHVRIRELEVADVEDIVVLPGAAELLRALADASVPTAIVTSGTRDLAEARIAATGLVHPPVVVTASDVERGKPWPDPWLLGARLLGVDPRQCIVVEDSMAGLRAARDAGCRGLVAVTSTTAPAELATLAGLVVPDLSHLPTEVAAGVLRVVVGAGV